MSESTDLVPISEGRALAAIEDARHAIEVAKSLGDTDTLRDWRDRAAAVQHYAMARDQAKGLADDAGEIKIRAEAALGQLDVDKNPHGGNRAEQDDRTSNLLGGIHGATRAAWRRLGQLDSDQLDQVVGRVREDDAHGVTTASAVKVARELYADPKPPPAENTRRQKLRAAFDADIRTVHSTARGLEKRGADVAAVASRNELDRWTVKTAEAIEHLQALYQTMIGAET